MLKKSLQPVKRNSDNESAPAQRVGEKGVSRNPPIQRKPIMQFKGGISVNNDAGLVYGTGVMDSKPLGSVQRTGEQSTRSASKINDPVVQGNFIKNWYRKKFGIRKGKYDQQSSPLLKEMGVSIDAEKVDQHIEKNKGSKASLVASGLKGVSSAVGKPADIISKISPASSGTALKVSSEAAGIGGIIGATGSLIDAGVALHSHITGNQLAGDKHLLKAEIASSLSSAGTSVGSSMLGFAHAANNTGLVSTAAKVASPFAIASGAFDVGAGLVGSKVASDREEMLKGIGKSSQSEKVKDVALLGEDAQETKKKTGVARALKGGLALAGGIVLAAGSGPIGWGLLGASALVGLGSTVYKMWRKNKHGKKALAGVRHGNIVEQEELNRILDSQSRLKKMSGTRAMRAHDIIRGAAADKLISGGNEISADEKEHLLQALGLKTNATGKQIAAALD
ncbi:hypothetical protein [Roseivirga thermotolerans]|nr:hypothetical protein [Roseivirga thermotolerans]